MTVSIKVPGAVFSKFFDIAFPQPSNLLGLYELFGATPLVNKAGGAALIANGTAPQLTLTGAPVQHGSGYDTGIIRPAGDFTFAALAKGTQSGLVLMGEFDNSLASGSAGDSLTFKANANPALQGVGGFFGNGTDSGINQTPLVSMNGLDFTKYYVLAATRVGLAIKVYLFTAGRNPQSSASTVASAETVARSVLLGTYRGASNGGLNGATELSSAAIWSRGLSLTDLQSVYDYYAAKAATLGIVLA